MPTAIQILTEQFTESSAALLRLLGSVSKDEFLWRPAEGAWSVHHRSDDCPIPADGSGDWVIDYVWPDPDPAPVTTMAWRAVHVASVNWMYWEYAFGPGELTFPALDLPQPAPEHVARWLEQSQGKLIEAMGSLEDSDLDEERNTNWGEQWPTRQLFKTLIHEQVHHGAEMSLLRDLWRARSN